MVSDKLLRLLRSHGLQGIESTSELTIKLATSLDDLLFDRVSLLIGNSGSKRELSQITSNSDTSGNDHGSVFRGKWWALKLSVVHVTNVAPVEVVFVVVLDDGLKERCKAVVRIF